MTEPPNISVIMPIYDGEACLPDSLGSIHRQAVAGLEIVLIDDGSTDRSAEVARRCAPTARYFFQANRGVASARNAGLAQARGALIAFLDMDDVWPDGSLTARVAALEENPTAQFALGRTRFSSPAGNPAPEPWVATNLGAGLFRREVFARVGQFNEGCHLTDDVEWFLRAREQRIPYVTLERETLCYRRRPGSITHGHSWRDPELAATIRASLARRRQSTGGQANELTLLSGSKDDPRAAGEVNHGS